MDALLDGLSNAQNKCCVDKKGLVFVLFCSFFPNRRKAPDYAHLASQQKVSANAPKIITQKEKWPNMRKKRTLLAMWLMRQLNMEARYRDKKHRMYRMSKCPSP